MKIKKILASIVVFFNVLYFLGGVFFIGEEYEKFSTGDFIICAGIFLIPGYITYKLLKYILSFESKEDKYTNKDYYESKGEVVINKYLDRVLKVDDLKQIGELNMINPYIDITPFILDNKNPIVHYDGLFLQEGEAIFYATPAFTFKDKNQVVGYSGGSSGISFRVSKGVSVRTGGHSRTPIRRDVRKYNDGDLVITNKRVVFIGKDDSFDYAIHKLSAIRHIDNLSFTIQAGNSFRNILLDHRVKEYAEGYISYSLEAYRNKINLKQEVFEQSLNDFYEQVRFEALKIYRNKKAKGLGCLGAILLNISVIVALIMVVVSFV